MSAVRGRGAPPAVRVHGWVVRAPLPLPCPPARPGARPDLVVAGEPPRSQGRAPRPLALLQDGPRGRPWLEAGATGEGFLLRYRGQADFLALPGVGLLVRPVPGAARATLRLLLLDSVLPHLLALRGETVLHAGAVLLGGEAILFLGPAGAGKSTLAALLARAGCPVLADDAVRVRRVRGRVVAEAGPPVLRLRPPARRLVGPGLGRSRPDARISGKVRVDLRPRGHAAPPGARPVRALLLLGARGRPGSARRLALQPPRGRDAVAAVADALFRVDLADPAGRRREFEAAADLVAGLPVHRLTLPRAGEGSPADLRGALETALEK